MVVGERTAAGDTFRVALCDEPDRLLADYGEVPLPPYIRTRLDDPERYQTVYARDPSSAAAPTAGLHLTPELIGRIEAMGVAVVAVELAVGLDTFQPVSEPDPRDHRMHSERYRVPASTWTACGDADRVVADRHHDRAGPGERRRQRTARGTHRAVPPPRPGVRGSSTCCSPTSTSRARRC